MRALLGISINVRSEQEKDVVEDQHKSQVRAGESRC